MSEYLIFKELPPNLRRSTKMVDVRSKRSGDLLGVISWFGAWRQYCFWPSDGTIFNVGCMNDICDEIGRLMAERKK